MSLTTWKYYNHAAIPTGAPYEKPDITPIENGTIWKEFEGKPLLARWTTDFDLGCESNFWFVIKDEPFVFNSLKSKRRYEIKKGEKNFEVKLINPVQFRKELYRVQVAAFSAYPAKYRPTVVEEDFEKDIDKWTQCDVFGAFHRETNVMVGYALLYKSVANWVDYLVQRTNPEYEKEGVNAALVYGLMSHYSKFLLKGGIICDGARSINHETHFQDYLEKYFGFRKAYCHLKIVYNPKVRWLIKLLFLFRMPLQKLDGIGIVHSINAVLRMEEICRADSK